MVRLRLWVHDALAARRGAATVAEHAQLHGVHRATMFRLRSGDRNASLDLAMRMAHTLDTTVDDLFAWTPDIQREIR